MILRDPGLLRAYEEYEKAASDWTSGMNGARREGREEGEKAGRAAGEQTKAAAVGRKLKGRGYDPDEIADITGLDIKTIESL